MGRLLIVLLVTGGSARADCTCDQTVAVGTQSVDASSLAPGKTLCLTAGSRGPLILNNLHGSAGNPVLIKNCGGLVDLASSTSAGLQISGSFFHLSGSGDGGVDLGIRVNSSAPGDNAVQIVGQSSDFELDHLEIAGASYAGIMAKADPRPNCDPAYTRPTTTFVMRNVSFHDLYIHETGGEGIYLGDSFYNGTATYNDGSAQCPMGQLQYPHELRGVRVFNVHVHDSGREAIQVGSAVDDVEIHHNLVELYGQGNLASQNGGIQLGVGTAARLYGNVLLGGTGEAVVVQGIGNDYVYNNVIAGAGAVSISVNTRPTPLASDIVNQGFLGGVYLIDNTIVDDNAKGAVIEYINAAQGNVFADNFIVSAAAKWNLLQGNSDWTVDHNVIVPTVEAAQFFGADHHLAAGSPARGQGRDATSFGVTSDAAGVMRTATPDVGAFQFLAPKSGGCAVGGSDGGFWLLSLLLLLRRYWA